jgi:protein MpaA
MKGQMRILAKTPGQRDLVMYQYGSLKLPKFVLIGGMHGDEPQGALVVEDFVEQMKAAEGTFKSCMIVIPRLNPDGLFKNERVNYNGVDLNRNFPASDWTTQHKAPRYNPGTEPCSEPEVRVLVSLLRQAQPFLVVHCHTYTPQICYTGEQSKKYAEMMTKDFSYPLTDDIGYPTPGSLGQFCHHELKTACVCVELPENVERTQAWRMIGPALLEIAQHGP